MQPFRNGEPCGDAEIVELLKMGQTAKRMFRDGADEIRVTKAKRALPVFNRAKRNAKNRAAKAARKVTRMRCR